MDPVEYNKKISDHIQQMMGEYQPPPMNPGPSFPPLPMEVKMKSDEDERLKSNWRSQMMNQPPVIIRNMSGGIA